MSALQSVLTDVNQILPILNHWFHLLSAVIWIGGLAFLVMALTPALRVAVPREFVKPLTDVIYKRYRKVVGILLFVILFTGGINLHYISQMMLSQTGVGITNNPKYLTVLFIKLALVLGVATIYLYTVIFRIEPTGEESQEELAEQLREPIPFQRAALWMGVFIILCAAALKYLHF
jgi:putative copper export protein